MTKIEDLITEFALNNGSCNLDEFRKFAKFVESKYCIVEKSKVLEEYKFYQESWNEIELTETMMDSFKDLFGEELFG